MAQTIKFYMGLFMILFLLSIGTGIVVAQLEITKAQNFKADVVTAVENSNYHPSVLSNCIRQAKEFGYELTVYLITPKDRFHWDETNLSTQFEEILFGEIILEFPVRVALFATEENYTLRSYTR